ISFSKSLLGRGLNTLVSHLLRLLRDLPAKKGGIASLFVPEFVMRSCFNQLAMLHNKDPIGVDHGTETMTDNDCGSSMPIGCQGLKNTLFCRPIQIARGFIKEQNGRIFEQ